MEHRTEEGDPLLQLSCFIVTDPKHWYMLQQIKQSTINYIHNTDSMIKSLKGKEKKVQRAYVHGAKLQKNRITIL